MSLKDVEPLLNTDITAPVNLMMTNEQTRSPHKTHGMLNKHSSVVLSLGASPLIQTDSELSISFRMSASILAESSTTGTLQWCILYLRVLTRSCSLPNLLSEIESQLEHCNSRLYKLPPPITAEPTTHVLTLITSFCQNVTLSVYGDPEHSELVQASRVIYSNYKREIRSSAPQFLPFVNKGELRGDVAGYLRLDDGESQDNMDDDESGLPTTKYIFLQDVRRRIER